MNPDLSDGKGASRTSKSAYPTGSNRKGVIVLTLTTAQQALVTTASEQWARQSPTEVPDNWGGPRSPRGPETAAG